MSIAKEKEVDIDSFRNPPPENEVKNGVLKKVGDSITIKRFEEILAMISWRLEFSGCKTYRILNHKHEIINFMIRNYTETNIELRLWDDKKLFGEDSSGFIVFDVQAMNITISDGDSLFLSFDDEKGNEPHGTIFFNNRDEPFTPQEEYINTKEKLYICRCKCTQCGKVLNESKEMSGIEVIKNSLIMGFSAVLVTKHCSNKECDNYWPDINIEMKTIWYKIKTNEPIEYKTIEKLHYNEKREYNKICREEKKIKECKNDEIKRQRNVEKMG